MKRKTTFRSVTRRDFLKGAVGAAGALAAVGTPYVITSAALGAEGKPPASDRIVMGCIGVGGQGSGDMGGFLSFPQVQGVAVCDVDKNQRDRAKNTVDNRNRNTDCLATNDFLEVVTRPDIDAVFCATPDHWHALVTVTAMRNGKDVYCEKPACCTIAEGRAMVTASQRYGRIIQIGSQEEFILLLYLF